MFEKDEEMAKEYAKTHIVQYPKRVIVSENGFCTSEDEVKQAFLAGLKAGRPQWHDLENGKFSENYKRVLITVLDDEGKRVVVSGMFVTKIVNRKRKTKIIRYWLYDSDDVFVTSGSPGECSKPIAWMPFPEPPEEE